jgi:hypothetical protein
MRDHAQGDVELAKLLTLSVGRVFSKAAKAGDDWTVLYDSAAIEHIADWLKASIVNNAPWLANVDSAGNPKKLTKFASIDQITQEADKAMAIAIQQQGQITLVEGDEELYATTSDGFHLVRLKTPAALDRESKAMQHCVGNGAYDPWLSMSDYTLLSFRDRHGNPHATIEIGNRHIHQIQGKQNALPRADYLESIVRYFTSEVRDRYDLTAVLTQHNLCLASDGSLVSNQAIPEGFESYGDVTIRDAEKHSITLPSNMTINGNLVIEGNSDCTVLDNISVTGNATIQNCVNLLEIGPLFKVAQNLAILDCDQIERLPAGMKLNWLKIVWCEKLKELPDGMELKRLDLSNTEITNLPDDIKISHFLDISRSKIDKDNLPKGLSDDLVVSFDPFEKQKTLGQIRKAEKARRNKEMKMASDGFKP